MKHIKHFDNFKITESLVDDIFSSTKNEYRIVPKSNGIFEFYIEKRPKEGIIRKWSLIPRSIFGSHLPKSKQVNHYYGFNTDKECENFINDLILNDNIKNEGYVFEKISKSGKEYVSISDKVYSSNITEYRISEKTGKHLHKFYIEEKPKKGGRWQIMVKAKGENKSKASKTIKYEGYNTIKECEKFINNCIERDNSKKNEEVGAFSQLMHNRRNESDKEKNKQEIIAKYSDPKSPEYISDRGARLRKLEEVGIYEHIYHKAIAKDAKKWPENFQKLLAYVNKAISMNEVDDFKNEEGTISFNIRNRKYTIKGSKICLYKTMKGKEEEFESDITKDQSEKIKTALSSMKPKKVKRRKRKSS